jgi:hypothetical protein
MGGIDLYFVDNEVEFRCRRKVIDCAYTTCQPVGLYSLGAPVRPPKCWGRVFVADHRLQSLRLLSVNFFLSGARPALPMGVAPEAIAEKISGIGSRI